MSCISFGEIPKMLIGVNADRSKHLRVLKLTYDSTMSCDVSLADWFSHIIDVDANGIPRIRLVELEEAPMTCDDIGDYGIQVCGIYIGHLVMATDGKPALGILTS